LITDSTQFISRIIGVQGCKAHFGLLLGGKAGLEDPDQQTLELDSHSLAWRLWFISLVQMISMI
jgi:hypothetical protein